MAWSAEERKIIDAMQGQIAHVETDLSGIRKALFDPGPGGSPPLIKRVVDAVVIMERSGWAGKMMIRAVLTAGALAAALTAGIALIKGLGKWPT